MEWPLTIKSKGCCTKSDICLPNAKSTYISVLSVVWSEGDKLLAWETLQEICVGLAHCVLQPA